MINYYIKMLVIVFLLINCSQKNKEHKTIAWNQKEEILKKTNPPKFKDIDFNIINYGAKGDNKFDNNTIINKVILECNKSGGGKVIIPSGMFLCNGPINLKSNVNLYLKEGATIKFGTNSNYYLPVVLTRFEGIECYNYSPLIRAFEEENISITGKGTFDAQASIDNWWNWCGSKPDGWKKGMPSQLDSAGVPLLRKMNQNNVPVEKRIFGKGHYLRPNFFQPLRCKNILLSGVTFLNSPMWFIHPVESENIIIKGVTVTGDGPNNDGCDPESCKDVLIEDCYFKTGDDCIAIKSGRNNDGRKIGKPSENIIIRNCKMEDGHGGVVIGSEISGGCKNIFVEDCKMDSPYLLRAIRIKTNMHRGGTVENIYVRNVKIGEVSEAILKINLKYDSSGEGSAGNYLPIVKNIFFVNVTSEKSKYGLFVEGLPESKIKNITLQNCNFKNVKKGNIVNNTDGIVFNESYMNNIPLQFKQNNNGK